MPNRKVAHGLRPGKKMVQDGLAGTRSQTDRGTQARRGYCARLEISGTIGGEFSHYRAGPHTGPNANGTLRLREMLRGDLGY